MKSLPPVVLFDACILYPAPLRDLLLQLSLTGVFRPKWTDAIHEEWIENLLLVRPDLLRQQLERTRELMNLAVPDATIIDYEELIPILRLPDPDDRHVLAAAIHGKAETIITSNLKDFPEMVLVEHGIVGRHPDEFVRSLLDLDIEMVLGSIKEVHSRLKNPAVTIEEYLQTLMKVGLTKTVKELKERGNLIL